MSTLVQRSFAAGEITPSLYYRVDLARYFTGLRTMRNCYTLKQGGAENRPGTQFIGELKDQGNNAAGLSHRIVPFRFSSTVSYVLEFGDFYIRFWKNGSLILNASNAITGITQADPAVVTSTAHGYSNGDEVYISGVGGMTELNGLNFKVANVAANTFELQHLDSTDVDSTGFGAYTSGGTVASVYEVSSAITLADLWDYNFYSVDYPDRGKCVLFTDRTGTAQVLILQRIAETNWQLYNVSEFTSGAPSVSLSTADGSSCKYTAVAVNAYDGLGSTYNVDTSAVNPTSGSPITVTMSGVTGPIGHPFEYLVFRADTFTGTQKNSVFGYIGSLATVAGSGGVFIDNNLAADYAITPDDIESFMGNGFYGVTCLAVVQNRLVVGGANGAGAIGIHGSRSGRFNVYSYIGAPTDASPYSFANIGGETSTISHVVDFNRMVVFTDSGEFVAFGDESGIVTPSSVNIRKQSNYVAANHPSPIVFDNTLFYIQKNGGSVLGMGYDINIDNYGSSDLSIYSNHLFKGFSTIDWGIARGSTNILWTVRSDGKVLSFTYSKEHQMSAWSRHDFFGAKAEGVCVLNEGTDDDVYFIVNRTVNGRVVKYMEKLSDRRRIDIRDYTLIDSHLSYDGRNTTATTMTLSGGTTWAYDETLTLTASASYFVSTDVSKQIQLTGANGELIRFTVTGYTSGTVVTGTPHKTVPTSLQSTATATWAKAVNGVGNLRHLEGEDVAIFADGFVVANPNNDSYDVVTVSGGEITLDKPYGVIHVGKPYFSDLETLDIDVPQGETLIDKNKLSQHITLGAEDTRGIWAGGHPPSDDATNPKEGLVEFKLRNDEDYDSPPSLNTETIDSVIQGDFNSHGRVFIRQIDPVPMTILSIAPSGVFPFRGT